MEGLPSTANRWLLTEVLREEWGFEGILVTDWDNVGRMVWEQKICPDFASAATLAVRAGNDLMMATAQFYEGAIEAVNSGMLDEAELDVPLRRVLELKFRMGLFENPGRSDPERQQLIGCAEHRQLDPESSRKSLVLLQNNDNFLPLDPQTPRRVAVVGPNADALQSQLGDWACASSQFGDTKPRRELMTTVREGLGELPSAWQVDYALGCGIGDQAADDLDAAVALATESDVCVVVVGDEIGLIGEYHSTATLELQGRQIELLDRLAATGKPLVVISIASKPHVYPASVHDAAAIIWAGNPGMHGGQAIAELIAGTIEPKGRLTVSFPYHVGQQPVYHAQVRGQHGDTYADLTQSPHFAFGEGLAYTSFSLSELSLSADKLSSGDNLKASCIAKNTGSRPGRCLVQAYVSDLVTSATWFQHELKGFAAVELAPGEEQEVTIEIPIAECSIVNAEGRRVVEAGDFRIDLAQSSRDTEKLSKTFQVV